MTTKSLLCCAISYFIGAGILVSASYDSAGRLTGVTQASGARISYVYDAAGNITSMTVVPATNAAPALTSAGAFQGEVGVPFEGTLTSNKANATFISDDLPPGLILHPVTGVISGTPTVAGPTQVPVAIVASGQTSNVTISIQVRPPTEIAWPRFAGNYVGTALASVPVLSAGTAGVAINPRGAFSAALIFKGQRVVVAGSFSSSGKFSKTIRRNGLSDLEVNLAISQVDGSVKGTISDGMLVADIEAIRPRVKSETVTWQAGAWTFVLVPAESNVPSAPKGSGYGIMSVAKSGAGTFVGSLPDGAKVSGRIILDRQNNVTFFQSLYRGQGFIAGGATFEGAPILSGEVDWSRPGSPRDRYFKEGFNATFSLEGSRFTPRAARTRLLDLGEATDNVRLAIGEETLSAPFTRVFTLDTLNRGIFAAPDTERLTFSISKTGIFSGSFLESTSNKTLRFSGVILQEQLSGAGFFLGVPENGGVLLETNP